MSGEAKFIDITTGLTTDKNGYGVGTLSLGYRWRRMAVSVRCS